MSGMGSHQSHAMLKDEWLTPPHILQALGPFDLDPCSPIKRPWPTAAEHYTVEDDGLSKPWRGRVWLNPPYGKHTGLWLARLADHGDGIALIFARTETEMFVSQVWRKAHGLLFIAGRLHFHHVDGTRASANGGAPSVLVAYGQGNAEVLRECEIPGAFVTRSGIVVIESGATVGPVAGARGQAANDAHPTTHELFGETK